MCLPFDVILLINSFKNILKLHLKINFKLLNALKMLYSNINMHIHLKIRVLL